MKSYINLKNFFKNNDNLIFKIMVLCKIEIDLEDRLLQKSRQTKITKYLYNI